MLLLLATGCCVERAWHTAHHRRGPPRAPGGVIGTIELQGAEGEVGLGAHARHPMQTKGVLLPLGQQPGGTGVGCSRVKQCSYLCPQPSSPPCLHHPPTFHDHFIPFSSPLLCCVSLHRDKGQVSRLKEPRLPRQEGSWGTCSQRPLWAG